MRCLNRRAAAGLVLSAALLAACGGDDDPEPTSAAQDAGTTTTAAPVADVDPQSALLTLDDLPEGYVVDPSDATGGGEGTPSSNACPELEAIDESGADDARSAEVAFIGSELGPFVFHAVGDQDPGTAAKEFDSFRAALRKPACKTFQDTDSDGRTVTWTLSRINTVRVGDDTLAFRLSADEAGMFMEFDFAVERVGDNVSTVGVTHVPRVGPVAPELSAVVRRAHQKLVGASA